MVMDLWKKETKRYLACFLNNLKKVPKIRSRFLIMARVLQTKKNLLAAFLGWENLRKMKTIRLKSIGLIY
jgi:hypothetical protein